MARMLCLSDMHLGDNKSALNNPKIVDKVTSDLVAFSDKSVDTLVLNGDVWEQCIPAGTLEENPGDGFCSSVAKASRYFFASLFSKISISNVVWVPGNHDLSLWKRLSLASGLPFHTSQRGAILKPSDVPAVKKFFEVLFDGSPQFKVAYPLFIAGNPYPDDFPYVMFTHGHLLDTLVRGEESEAAYIALRALGCKRPTVPADPESVARIAELADDFTLALWKQDSTVDYTFWNMIVRRLAHPQSCPLAGHETESVTRVNHPASTHDGLMPKVQAFLETVLADPNLPTPVGSLRQTVVAPAFSKPSCLVFGHDHLGTVEQIGACGVPFRVFDSGGWTVEFDGHVPHSHALVWPDEGTTPNYVYLSLAA